MPLKTTKDIYHHLHNIGLTLNEAEIYVYLLQNGPSLGSSIYKNLGKDKSSTYRSLSSLIENDLVYKVGESRNQKFGANPQENLLSIVEVKKDKLEETSLHLKNFLKTIKKNSKSEFQKGNITIYESDDGKEKLYRKILSSKDQLIRRISSKDFDETTDQKRIQKAEEAGPSEF